MIGMAGHVELRRGLMAHIESGKLSIHDLGMFIVLLLLADPSSGCLNSNTVILASKCRLTYKAARGCLDRLERENYIKCFKTEGRGASFWIAVGQYKVTIGARIGEYLDVVNTTDYSNPAYSKGKFSSKTGQVKGQVLGMNRTSPNIGREETRSREEEEAAPAPLVTFSGSRIKITPEIHAALVHEHPAKNFQLIYPAIDAWLEKKGQDAKDPAAIVRAWILNERSNGNGNGKPSGAGRGIAERTTARQQHNAAAINRVLGRSE